MQKNDFCIVTFDADFSDFANIYGCPPKIIWLRTGNMTTNFIVSLLEVHCPLINEFLNNNDYKEIACMEIE